MKLSAIVLTKYNKMVQIETSKNAGNAAPGKVNEAKCQIPQANPTKKVLLTKEWFSKSFGSIKPLHPNSSPMGPNGKAAKINNGILVMLINQLTLRLPSNIIADEKYARMQKIKGAAITKEIVLKLVFTFNNLLNNDLMFFLSIIPCTIIAAIVGPYAPIRPIKARGVIFPLSNII